MRDYIVNEVRSRQAYGSVTWLVRLVTNWRMRKTLKQLREYQNYHLSDIGLDRCELERLIAAPLNTDHIWLQETRLKTHPKKHESLALPNLGRAVFDTLAFNRSSLLVS